MRTRLCSPAGMLHEDLTVCKMREFLDLVVAVVVVGGFVVVFLVTSP